jgi:hypothetical protein
LTGVAATVLAVTIFSPAGFGGMIGASLASSFGVDTNNSSSDNPYANLPAYPTPLSPAEVSAIRSQLAATQASLEITRAATDPKIEHVRTLALGDGMVTFTPTRQAAAPSPNLRLTLSQPASFVQEAEAPEAPVESYIIESPQVDATATPASYSGGGYDAAVPYRDPHLELADLLLAHETF